MVREADVLTQERAAVMAPAGCGKTELIARIVSASPGKRVLVLTHTNAGLRALRERLDRLRVPTGAATVDTIAGWALRYATAYPARCAATTADPAGAEWDDVYRGVRDLISARALQTVLQASYARVLVDEYQDCSRLQHELVSQLAVALPTCVFGDPLQAIFDFEAGAPSWADVVRDFPLIGTLSVPWRWKDKNPALGAWCLAIRDALIHGEPIRLADAPLTWRAIEGRSQAAAAYTMSRRTGSAVIIRKWERNAHAFARSLGGLFRSIEEVEGRALRSFATAMDLLEGPPRAARLLELAAECMTGVNKSLGSAAKALQSGVVPTSRQARKHPGAVQALAAVCGSRSMPVLLAAMDAIAAIPDCRKYRSELWRSARKAVKDHATSGKETLAETATMVRLQQRAMGRSMDPRVVSRTLLVKGLEFEHALVPAAEEFEDRKRPGHGARHFYVAVTRGGRSLTVLSRDPSVRFLSAA